MGNEKRVEIIFVSFQLSISSLNLMMNLMTGEMKQTLALGYWYSENVVNRLNMKTTMFVEWDERDISVAFADIKIVSPFEVQICN